LRQATAEGRGGRGDLCGAGGVRHDGLAREAPQVQRRGRLRAASACLSSPGGRDAPVQRRRNILRAGAAAAQPQVAGRSSHARLGEGASGECGRETGTETQMWTGGRPSQHQLRNQRARPSWELPRKSARRSSSGRSERPNPWPSRPQSSPGHRWHVESTRQRQSSPRCPPSFLSHLLEAGHSPEHRTHVQREMLSYLTKLGQRRCMSRRKAATRF
jgi:hypothetical protein